MFTLRKGRICPVCEKGKLQVEIMELPFVYKNRTKKIPDQKVFVCDVCDYEGLTDVDNKKVEKLLADFRRTIDGLLSCGELESIRKGLGLNKKSMARLLSVNEKTVGRYENGKITQSAQVDKLYRVFQAAPFLTTIIEPSISSSKFETSVFTVAKDNYIPELAEGYCLQGFQADIEDQEITANAA